MQKQDLKLRKGDIKNYYLEAEIGHGASGVCYKAVSKVDGSICAIKKISINTIKGNSLKMALKQVEVLKQLQHPNIIKYYDSFADESYLYIVMQYAEKGDLHAMLKRKKIKQQFYQEKEIWEMAKQLLQALKYLHSKNIVHRDFKTLNIFIGEKNNLLVGDLGVSKIIKNDMGLYSRVGTPLYLAPEIIKYQKYDYKADIWGFGCVLYISTALSHPFQGKNIINLGQNILHNDPKQIPNYSNQLNLLIKSALQKNPAKRPDAKNLLQQYFSSQAQKLRQKITIERSSLRVQANKYQEKQKQRPTRYSNTFFENPKNASIVTPKFLNNYNVEDKEKKDILKNINYDDKHTNNDQTIMLHPQSIKIDGPQEKTRIRAIFNCTKSKLNSNWMVDVAAQSDKNIKPEIFKKDSSRDKGANLEHKNIKPEAEKVQTQIPQLYKKQISSDLFLRHRSIQSAKPRKEGDDSKDGYSSCQKLEKQNFVISSVNRIFFQCEVQKQAKRCTTRPKSSLGRKPMLTSNQIKFVKRRNTSQQQNISHTRTQLLRKPQMIII